jgi:hypothetical protein
VAWGDSRGNSSGVNTSALSNISNQVNGLSPRPVFTLFDGDLCYTWNSTCTSTGASGWKYAINNGSPGNGLFSKTFVWRGNHDDSASGWDAYFNMQATVTAIGGTNFSYYANDGAKRTYSFDYGNSHFVGIDMPGGDISTLTSGQISWLDSDITAAEGRGVTHTFIVIHGPIYYVNEHASTPASSLITVMNKHASISATFHGHEHVLAYVHMDSSCISSLTHPFEEFVSGGAGAPAYACANGRSDYCVSNTGFVSVDVNGSTFTVNLYLQGGGPGPAHTWTFTKSTPAVTLTPATASFGNQSVGTTSAAQALTLKNGTASSVSISSIAITGTNSGDFAQTNGCGSSLAAGAQCTINVTFKPTAIGTRTGSVTVTDSATGSPHTAALSGTGVTNSASVSPTSLSFPSQTVGTTSTAQSSTLTNAGTISLAITSIVVSGDFAETDNCGSSVAAGGSCTISVTFRPTAAGSRAGTVTINDSASNTPQTLSLTGTGTAAAAVSLSPASLTFASRTVGTTSAAQTSTLTNSGGTALTVTSIAASGDFAQTNNCGSSVAAGGSCTISVTFKPTATGTRTGTVTVTDSAATSPQILSLTGTGAAAVPAVSLSPASLTFASQTVGGTSAAQAVTLSNTGGSALTITSISTAPPFAQTNNCGSSVAAGASCTVSVTFTPTVVGTVSGTLAVADNAAGSPQAVSLTGTGTSSGGGTLNYYVSPSGSNSSGDGSAASPWATIAYASTRVGPGATVHVAPGTYSGPEFSTNSSGTASAHITYISDTKWGAKLVGTSGSTWSNYGNYVDIVNFDVTGPGYNGIYTEGDHTRVIGNNVHDVLINRCDSNGGSGINLNGTNAEVNGNFVHDNGPKTACGYVHGIYFLLAGGSAFNNIVFGNAGWGIQLWHDPSHITIVNNTLFRNETGAIVIGNDITSADYCVVNNNIAYDNARGISEEGNTGTHNVYQNNLVYQNPTSNISLQNGNTATGTVSANPLFVNYTGDKTGDYHLQSTSPAENAGTTNSAPTPDYDGCRRPYGSLPDNGALEYAGSSTSTVTLSPSSLTFAGQAVGTTSTAQTLTLKNGTSSSLTISSVAITGTNSGDFALTNGCGASLAAAASCTINVTFKPTASGTRSATLTVTDSGTGSPRTASLTGTGTAPAASLSPTSVGFGNQSVSTTSAAQAVTLTNSGNAPLTIRSIAITGTNSGDFAQTNGCGASLAVGASCTISVTFTPAASGSRTTTLSVTDNATGSPHTAALSGTGVASSVRLSPTSLTFASQTVGTTSTAQVATLTNTGTTSLTITSVGISGDFAQTNNCGSSVAASGSCTISVTFKPTVAGTRTGTVTITDSAPTSPQTISLTGTATASTVILLPTSLTFASQAAGTTSPAQTLTLTNGTGAALTISGVVITGTNSGDFAQTNGCGASLAAAASCTINVTFKPTAAGSRSATLAVTDNATGSPRTASLTGTGTAPAVTLSPASLTFASQTVGTTSTPQSVTLTNTGNATLTFSGSPLFSGDFASASGGTCGTTVAAGASCTIAVNFKPTATGTRTGAVTINDNCPYSPQTIPLTGTGAASTVTLSPSSLTFASQAVGTTSAAQALTLTNSTGSALAISSVAVTGTNSGDFAQTNGCGASLAVGASCTISVTFKPTAAGTRSATLAVTDNATGSPRTASLTGTGGSSTVIFSPNPLSFPNQTVGTSSAVLPAMLTNAGTSTLTFTSNFAISGDFSFDPNSGDCSSTLAAGASCAITVIFTPTASGARTGAVTVNDSAAGSPHILLLTGTGAGSTSPTLSVSPTTLTFARTRVGTTSAPQTVTLTNTSSVAATISSIAVTGPYVRASSTCGSTLAAGSSCAVSVTFTPTVSGTQTGTLAITDNAIGSPQLVGLTGRGR